MTPRPKKVAPRDQAQGKTAGIHTFPAPTRGLVLNENMAATQPGGALRLDNWICTATGIKARGGTTRRATLGSAVQSMFAYKSGASEILFAATGSAIYNITAVSNVSSVPAPVVSGLSGGDFSAQQFGTAGGDFLYAVNGTDSARLFDGSTWRVITAASAPYAITGVATSALSCVWSYANRLFFVQKNTLYAWALPAASIAGAAVQISLAGVFQRGGTLLFGATWSTDSGSGLDDMCAFFSSEGEVAIYKGLDPASATDWSLQGVYQITRPLGKSAYIRAGGDLLVATETGLVPLSAALSKDAAALSMASVSAPIEPLWLEYVSTYPARWTAQKWPELGILLVSMTDGARDGETLCCNLKTGAWSRFTNIGAACLGFSDGAVFAGGVDGIVRRLESGGSDCGAPFTAVYLGLYEGTESPAAKKTFLQMLAQFRAGHAIAPSVSAAVDYSDSLPPLPASSGEFLSSVWDIGTWDNATWDSGSEVRAVKAQWRSVGKTGRVVAPVVQLTFGTTSRPSVELVSVAMTYETGAIVA